MQAHRDKAKGKWVGLLSLAGLDSKYLRNKHTDCPICKDGKDRYRFDNKDGKGMYICNQCGSGDGFELMQRALGFSFKQTCDFIDKYMGEVKMQTVETIDYSKRLNDLKTVWTKAENVKDGDDASNYLKSRFLEVPKVLKLYNQMPYIDEGKELGKFNVMLARVADKDGNTANLHRTYLHEGKKANVPNVKKLMQGAPFKGGAIRLYSYTNTLGLAEGIETAIACKMTFDIPTWACINAGNLREFEPPQGITNIVIFSDNDKNFTGQASAYHLANRLHLAGYSVDVMLPVLNDFADDLISDRKAKVNEITDFVKSFQDAGSDGQYKIETDKVKMTGTF